MYFKDLQYKAKVFSGCLLCSAVVVLSACGSKQLQPAPVEDRTREERAGQSMALISQHFNTKQQVFLAFVLSHYVAVGIDEMDQSKLTPLLKLKYNDSIADAIADLGEPEEIGKAFSGFQRYLYEREGTGA